MKTDARGNVHIKINGCKKCGGKQGIIRQYGHTITCFVCGKKYSDAPVILKFAKYMKDQLKIDDMEFPSGEKALYYASQRFGSGTMHNGWWVVDKITGKRLW